MSNNFENYSETKLQCDIGIWSLVLSYPWIVKPGEALKVSCPLCCLVRSKCIYLFQFFAIFQPDARATQAPSLVPTVRDTSVKEKNLPVHLKQCLLQPHFPFKTLLINNILIHTL